MILPYQGLECTDEVELDLGPCQSEECSTPKDTIRWATSVVRV